MTMELNENHRKLLSMRTRLNKFAVQAGLTEEREPLITALRELVQSGYVEKIDTFFHLETGVVADVYLLTPKGTELVERENIVATSP